MWAVSLSRKGHRFEALAFDGPLRFIVVVSEHLSLGSHSGAFVR